MTVTGKLTVYRTYYLLDDVYDGDVDRSDTREDIYYPITASDAARIISQAGLSFAATGNSWAADPDGCHMTNYGTGQVCETSAHLDGFAPRLLNAIMTKVG